MSGLIISDGTGKGYSAVVDNHGRLSTKANMVSHLSHHVTTHKNVYARCFNTTLPDGTETAVLYFKNDSNSEDILIHDLIISANADIEYYVRAGEDYSSGGAALDMLNTNSGVNIMGEGFAYEGSVSGDLVISNQNAYQIDGGFISASPFKNNYKGALLLAPTGSMTIYAIGAATNKVKITMVYTSHPEGTQL